jgi:hypothetical protein
MAGTAAYIVLDEARRAVDEQQAELDDARRRAGLVFTVAGITASFLAGPALDPHKGLPMLGAFAIGLWAGAAVSAIAVLLPWRFKFSVHPLALLGPGWGTLSGEEMGQQVGFVLGRNIDFNMAKLRWLWRGVQAAMLLTGASIAVWIALLAKGS